MIEEYMSIYIYTIRVYVYIYTSVLIGTRSQMRLNLPFQLTYTRFFKNKQFFDK